MKQMSIVFCFGLLCSELFSQKIVERRDFYLNSDLDTVFFASYTVVNNSSNFIALWFSKKNTANEYFNYRQPHQDFALVDLLNDESVNNKQLNILTLTFVKCLKPRDSFEVDVMYANRDDWSMSSFRKYIKTANFSEISPGLRSSLRNNIQFSFKSSKIVVIHRDF